MNKDCENYDMFEELSLKERQAFRERLEAYMHVIECDTCRPLFYAES